MNATSLLFAFGPNNYLLVMLSEECCHKENISGDTALVFCDELFLCNFPERLHGRIFDRLPSWNFVKVHGS